MRALERSGYKYAWSMAGIGALLFTLVVGSSVGAAIGKQYFNNNDVNPSTTIAGVVGKTKYVKKASVYAKAYFKTAAGGKINIIDYAFCPANNKYDDNGSSGSDGAKITEFIVTGVKGGAQVEYGKKNKDCKGTLTFNVQFDSRAKNEQLGLFEATIDVRHLVSSGGSNAQNMFRITTDGYGVSHASSPNGKGSEVTVEQVTSSPKKNIDYQIPFGTDCTVKTKNKIQKIALYDVDNNGGSGAQLNGKVTVSLKMKGTTRKIKVTTESNTNKVKMTGLVNSAKPEGDNKTIYLYFYSNPGETYNLNLDNVYNNNTVQFNLPFDGIYFDKPCSPPPPSNKNVWNATPGTTMTLQVNSTGSSVAKNGTSTNPTWVKPGDTVRWQHTVTNNVTSDRKTNKKITVKIKRNYDEGNLANRSWASGQSPGARMTNNTTDGRTGSGKMKRVIAQADMGEKICQRVAIDPSGIKTSGSTVGEKTSAWRCVWVTATGGDVEANVSVSPSTYSYYPSLTSRADVTSTGFPVVDRFKGTNYKRTGYGWKMFEAKFTSRPSGGIGNSTAANCNSVSSYSSMIAGSCKVAGSGSNLFASGGSPTVTAGHKQQGPDPIGTWTCYTLQYRMNAKPTQALQDIVQAYVTDWNDKNSTSTNSAWTDGRHKVPAKYNSDGELVRAAYWVGAKKTYADEYKKYKEAVPLSPLQYRFTPFDSDSCSLSGIDPKVQIRDDDLKVDGGINTSLRINSQGTFGSSAEYGVLSSGPNSGMASGSGLLAGAGQVSPQANWSPLTFTNNVPNGFGNFDGVPADSDEPEPTDIIEGNATFNGLPSAATAQGARKVYKINGTLVITGNLQYPNTYTKISKIPRVVIVADNIQIESNVTRIDPWLIAGNISTCGAPRGAAWGDSAGEALSGANLKIGECNNPLVFNGAVSVANLYLYRTGGSRVPKADFVAPMNSWPNPDAGINPNVYCEGTCGGRKYALSAPAEVFNLRPDVYLSSLSGVPTGGPVAATDKITELPPRF